MITDDIVHGFNEDLWLEYHNGGINSSDEFFRFQDEWIQSQVIYTSDCKEIIAAIGESYLFESHDIYGRPSSWSDAAHNAIYDTLRVEVDAVTWASIVDQQRTELAMKIEELEDKLASLKP